MARAFREELKRIKTALTPVVQDFIRNELKGFKLDTPKDQEIAFALVAHATRRYLHLSLKGVKPRFKAVTTDDVREVHHGMRKARTYAVHCTAEHFGVSDRRVQRIVTDSR